MNNIHPSHDMPNKNTQYDFNNLLTLLTISNHTLNQQLEAIATTKGRPKVVTAWTVTHALNLYNQI